MLLDALPPRRIGDKSSLVSRFTPVSDKRVQETKNERQWPPPRRRTDGIVTVDEALRGSRFIPRAAAVPSSLVESDSSSKVPPQSKDGFNAPLYTGAAFGIATLIVAVCASVTVWGVKATLGVKDVRQRVWLVPVEY